MIFLPIYVKHGHYGNSDVTETNEMQITIINVFNESRQNPINIIETNSCLLGTRKRFCDV